LTERLLEQPSAEAVRVAQSMLSIMANLHERGIERLRAMDEGDVELLPLSAAVDTIRETNLLIGPVKLELLDRLVKGAGRTPQIENLARSLIPEEGLAGDEFADDLLRRLAQDRIPGRDPLARLPGDLAPRDHAGEQLGVPELFNHLQVDLQTLSVTFDIPHCHAERVAIGNRVALSIATEGWSTRELKDFKDLSNPLMWPQCELQHTFFRSMELVRDGNGDPVNAHPLSVQNPDAGYSHVLREVVDFSLGWGLWRMTTDLDVVYFEDDERVGCTYDFNRSIDHQISIDQGYVLAEQVTPAQCRITTLKQVRFTIGNLPPGFVCPIWGPTTALLAWACLPHHP